MKATFVAVVVGLALLGSTALAVSVVSTIDDGGQRVTSANYTMDGSIGMVGGVSTNAAAPEEIAKAGFAGQLSEVVSLIVTGVPSTVNEYSNSQFSASATLDDDTLVMLAGSDVSWALPVFPIVSISVGGLATTTNVYQDTSAVVTGMYNSATGFGSLLVLDTNPDDFGAYGGDGLPDSWQVQYFGLPPNPNAAPGADPDSDGFSNLMEFLAGSDPTNSASYPVAPVITSGPTVTNALSRIGNISVVAVDETNVFTVGATNGVLSYQWTFGDGAVSDWSSSSNASHAYVTDCGPYDASVIVSNNVLAVSSNFTVAVACSMNITKMGVKLNFAKPNSDSCSLTATLNLGTGYNLTNKVVTVDVGGAQVPFTLDAKGKGKGASAFGSCKLAYNKKLVLWTLTVKLAKGTWRTPWGAHGLVNDNVPKMPVTSVTMPVVVAIDAEAFAGERTMVYTAKYNKSGSAK